MTPGVARALALGVLPGHRDAIAKALELEAACVKIRMMACPEDVDAAMTEAVRRGQRQAGIVAGYESVARDLAAGWRPPRPQP